jgi:hypothetical protein
MDFANNAYIEQKIGKQIKIRHLKVSILDPCPGQKVSNWDPLLCFR